MTAVRPNSRRLVACLEELASHRELLLNWVGRELKVRYKQSALGAAWAILQPLSATLIFAIIFSQLVRVPTDGVPYVLFYFAALLPWTFLASSLTLAVPSLVSNIALVTKTYFPREILPIAGVLACLADLGVASLVFAALLAIYRVRLTVYVLWAPVIIGLETLLTVGVVLCASAINVFYRDIRFVVPLASQIWMYLTPVIYPLQVVPERLRPLYMLNPMAGLIDSYRSVTVMGQAPNPLYLGLAATTSLAAFVLGYRFFKRVEMRFADVI